MPGEEIRAAIEAALGDPSRVAAAARLLREAGTETSLDRLTALAKRLVGASAVHVAVLTDRLVVVSRQGLPVGELDTGELHGTLCGLTASLSSFCSRFISTPDSLYGFNIKCVAVEITPWIVASFSETKDATSRRFLPSTSTSKSYPPDIK